MGEGWKGVMAIIVPSIRFIVSGAYCNITLTDILSSSYSIVCYFYSEGGMGFLFQLLSISEFMSNFIVDHEKILCKILLVLL